MIVVRAGIVLLPPDRLYGFVKDGRNVAALKEQPEVSPLRLLRQKPNGPTEYIFIESMRRDLDWYSVAEILTRCCDRLLALPEPDRWYIKEQVA